MTDLTMGRGAEFRVGNVLSRAWQILGANFVVFFCIALVVASPTLIYLSVDPRAPRYMALFFAGTFIEFVVNTIGTAVILLAAFQRLLGEPVRIGEAVQRVLARFLPLIGLGILVALGLTLGYVLLIVPGIILQVMWSVAVPVCIVEALGPLASMSRSSELTRGYRWPIFGIVLLLGIVSFAVILLLGVLLDPAGLALSAIANVMWTALWTAYWNCALIMIYHDLRVAKEGLDTRQIASIFD